MLYNEINSIDIIKLNDENKKIMLLDEIDLIHILEINENDEDDEINNLIYDKKLLYIINNFDEIFFKSLDEINLIDFNIDLNDIFYFFKTLKIKEIKFNNYKKSSFKSIKFLDVILEIFKDISNIENKKYIIKLNNNLFDSNNENTIYFYDYYEIKDLLYTLDFFEIIEDIDINDFIFKDDDDLIFYYDYQYNNLHNFYKDNFNYDLIDDYIYDIFNYSINYYDENKDKNKLNLHLIEIDDIINDIIKDVY